MRIPRIYTPQQLSSNCKVELEEDASHHLLKVLRMDVGRPLTLFNGDGHQYHGSISRTTKKTAVVIIQKLEHRPNTSPIDIELAIGLSKGDRFEWVLQKATELGVQKISPLFTERSEVKLSGERLEKKQQSWQKIIIGACEQCERNVIPKLAAPQKLEDFLPTCDADVRLTLHHRSPKPLNQDASPKNVALLVGPEGGLSDTEIALAEKHDFSTSKFGSRVLRTETAPLTALSIVQYLWGDLG